MGKPKNKFEFREELANAFASVLETKGLQWTKEWQGKGGQSPYNGITKISYKGVNAFYLSLVAMVRGYDDPRWVTMVQIMDKSGKYHPKQKWHLKKGSKATYVEYWYPYDCVNKVALTWTQYNAELQNGRDAREFTLSTRYTGVFNACEVEGMPDIPIIQNTDIKQDELIQKLITGMQVQIFNDGGDQAYYSYTRDEIHVPAAESFKSEYAYNATVLHELAHSTGHETRLNRKLDFFFGSSEYAYEELVAEMTSCFMGTELNAEPTQAHIDNHKAYVKCWVSNIREKPEALIKAIKDAQAAANFMDFKAGIISEEDYEAAKAV